VVEDLIRPWRFNSYAELYGRRRMGFGSALRGAKTQATTHVMVKDSG